MCQIVPIVRMCVCVRAPAASLTGDNYVYYVKIKVAECPNINLFRSRNNALT